MVEFTILECLLGLASKQGAIAFALLHAHPEYEKVYIQVPMGFKQYDSKGRQKVLRLK